MALKIVKSKKKNSPVKCIFCDKILGWIRFNNKKMIFTDIFLRQVIEIETKTFEVFCYNCGQGMKITNK